MRTWTRSRGLTERCGQCGHAIPHEAPMVVITRRGNPWKLLRCATCAGEPPVPAAIAASVSHPPDEQLAAFIEGGLPPDERTAVVQHVADCGDCREVVTDTQAALVDVKLRQTGERE